MAKGVELGDLNRAISMAAGLHAGQLDGGYYPNSSHCRNIPESPIVTGGINVFGIASFPYLGVMLLNMLNILLYSHCLTSVHESRLNLGFSSQKKLASHAYDFG